MWVKFKRDHDWPLGPDKVIAYREGHVFELRDETAAELTASGAAEEYPAPADWQAEAIRANRNREPDEWPRKPRAARLAEEAAAAEAAKPRPRAKPAEKPPETPEGEG